GATATINGFRRRVQGDWSKRSASPCSRPRQPLQTPPVPRPVHIGPIEIGLPDPIATRQFAERLADVALPRDIIALGGTLGMGKTAFARGFIQHLTGAEEVPSPTFTLVQSYDFPAGTIWHFDLYRLNRPEDVWELGFEDALEAGILLIEWPERLGALLPARRLDLALRPGAGPQARRALLDARGGSDLIDRLEGR
ncbi:MAG: tRNA threonylcarbamoyladenosine biosynthesis protein TsaE, partial [Aliidongia sp.]|nr:tRNA threonylcarbamoyladenosine biosynthesis protein TsaE [Aliidongia sp.]